MCMMSLYGNFLLDLYGEEHAVMCSPDGQTHYGNNSKPVDGICNPNIPIKAPQVVTDLISCTCMGMCSKASSFVTVYCQSKLYLNWRQKVN